MKGFVITNAEVITLAACPWVQCQSAVGKHCVMGRAFGPFVRPHKSRVLAARRIKLRGKG
jgi:hypothetical protein